MCVFEVGNQFLEQRSFSVSVFRPRNVVLRAMIDPGMISSVSNGPMGLSEAEAQRLLNRRGLIARAPSSRSYTSIVLANVFTVFNLILLLFGAVALTFGDPRDALFLGVLVSNSAIGIIQEARAKRVLDRLARLIAPAATVLRDGRPRKVHIEEVVPGDFVQVEAGDGIVADGQLETCNGLYVDESILTGESVPVARIVGQEVRSGTFVVEGSGTYRVVAVGAASYAEKLLGDARRFRHPRSPLERALNRLLFTLAGVMVPMGAILGYALWERKAPLDEAATTALAGIIPLLPEGLIVLASVTYAVAAVRMGRRGALVQQLNAVESLASVDVVCFDKTGTLTEPTLRLVDVIPVADIRLDAFKATLGRYAAISPNRNATLQAIADALPMPDGSVEWYLPFASRRRWGALRFGDVTYVLGAPEIFELEVLAETAAQESARGRRVLAFGTTDTPTQDLDPDMVQVPKLALHGVVILAEKLRPETRATVGFLLSQNVQLKVFSGDAPQTVASIAADAGIPLDHDAVDGNTLPEDMRLLSEVASRASVLGRVTPEDKRRLVEALQGAGCYVAMIGDGVNDVPAMKAARLAIAQGTGSQMARSIADIVLVHGDFASFPLLVTEGRTLLRNLMRVSKLFVSKSAFAVFLILTVGITPVSYALLPRHLTLLSSLSVGIPAFFLALARSTGPWRTSTYLHDVARFAVPAGAALGIAVLSSYSFSLHVLDAPLVLARTVATTAFMIVGLYLILALENAVRSRTLGVLVLCACLASIYVLALALPVSREFFDLALPKAWVVLVPIGGAAAGITGLWLTDDQFRP